MSIKLYKGDSSDFSDQRQITVSFITPFPLEGCSAVFSLQGVDKTFDDVSGGVIQLVYSATDTALMTVGECFGTLRIFDPSGRVKTVTNQIPFEITQDVIADETDTVNITVIDATGDTTIEVVSTLGYIGEAPADGALYGRKDGAWTPVSDTFIEKLGTDWNVTGWTELKTADISTCTDAELRDIIGTLIGRLKIDIPT